MSRRAWGTSDLSAQSIRSMKAHALPLTALAAAIATLGSGCASSSQPPPPPPAYSQYPNSYPAEDTRNPNNTARGAVAGAVAGAVLGGIIGNNSEHGNTEKGAAIGAVAGGIAGGVIGHHADQRETGGVYSPDRGYIVQTVPQMPGPEPYEQVPPQPAQQAIWIHGYYDYVGNGYQWIPGRWEVPPGEARAYIGPSWQPAARGGYIYVRGHWQ